MKASSTSIVARSVLTRRLLVALTAGALISLTAARAQAEALLLADLDSGKVLHAHNAAMPWYPASLTKIMTTYLTLRAIREGRLRFDTLLNVSANAAAQQPVKMGFPVGTKVTVDNALKMLLVKSANDIAVVLAEGVAGSIDNFSAMMNKAAARLGMTESSFVNPNGLPAEHQITSARDLAILVRAVKHEFPEYDYLWHLPGIRYGRHVTRNYNPLLGRYPGADGMKTGFICAAGFNLVATATRGNKHLVAIVLGAPSARARAIKAAQLLEEGFNPSPLVWLTPSLGTIKSLVPINADPPNLHDEVCGRHRKRPPTDDEDVSLPVSVASSPTYTAFLSKLRAPKTKAAELLQDAKLGEPIVVFTGPTLKHQSKSVSAHAKANAKKARSKKARARRAKSNHHRAATRTQRKQKTSQKLAQ